MKPLPPVVRVIEENCTKCNSCIRECPVRFCNDGSSEECIALNPN